MSDTQLLQCVVIGSECGYWFLTDGEARALELFIEALIVKSAQVTHHNSSRTLSTSHMYDTHPLT